MFPQGPVVSIIHSVFRASSLSVTATNNKSCVCVCVCACSVTQLCTTLCDSIDCSPPVSSVHRISQAKILECVAISYSRKSFNPGIEPVSLASPPLASGFFTTSASWEALMRVKCVCFALEYGAQGWLEWTHIKTLGGDGYRMPSNAFLLKDRVSPGENIDVWTVTICQELRIWPHYQDSGTWLEWGGDTLSAQFQVKTF